MASASSASAPAWPLQLWSSQPCSCPVRSKATLHFCLTSCCTPLLMRQCCHVLPAAAGGAGCNWHSLGLTRGLCQLLSHRRHRHLMLLIELHLDQRVRLNQLPQGRGVTALQKSTDALKLIFMVHVRRGRWCHIWGLLPAGGPTPVHCQTMAFQRDGLSCQAWSVGLRGSAGGWSALDLAQSTLRE